MNDLLCSLSSQLQHTPALQSRGTALPRPGEGLLKPPGWKGGRRDLRPAESGERGSLDFSHGRSPNPSTHRKGVQPANATPHLASLPGIPSLRGTGLQLNQRPAGHRQLLWHLRPAFPKGDGERWRQCFSSQPPPAHEWTSILERGHETVKLVFVLKRMKQGSFGRLRPVTSGSLFLPTAKQPSVAEESSGAASSHPASRARQPGSVLRLHGHLGSLLAAL
ncbi:uncharacterized protein LOC114673599 [Macaca mulatta]